MKKKFKNLAKRIACITATSLVMTVTALTPLTGLMPQALDNSITAYADTNRGRLFNQWDEQWYNTVYPDGATLHDSGCGIFSTANAVYSLTGNKMDPQAIADFAYTDDNEYGKCLWGEDGVLWWDYFFEALNTKYGNTYGFKVDEMFWSDATDIRLTRHLGNGGVAVAHVYRHFLAIDGYDSSNNTYHVIESAISAYRGLDASGWVSLDTLSTGYTKADYFVLISKRNSTPQPTTPTSKPSISPISYPSSINAKSTYNLTGSITSRYPVVQFTGEILQYGSVRQRYSYNPNSTNVNICYSPVNTNMRFDQLAAGSYQLKYTAKDSRGGTATWTCNFTVKSIASTLTIRPSSYPTTSYPGNYFNLTGSVSSNYNITFFAGEIISNSSVKQSYAINPNSTYVDIKSSAVNTYMEFNKLPAGSYTLRYTARDTSGRSVTWTTNFQVKSLSSNISIDPVSYPLTISRGSSYNLTGSVSSNYRITMFQGQIVQGSTIKQSYTVYPNSTYVNIRTSAVNTNLRFNLLSSGHYLLKYNAKDASGKTITWSRYFTVK